MLWERYLGGYADRWLLSVLPTHFSTCQWVLPAVFSRWESVSLISSTSMTWDSARRKTSPFLFSHLFRSAWMDGSCPFHLFPFFHSFFFLKPSLLSGSTQCSRPFYFLHPGSRIRHFSKDHWFQMCPWLPEYPCRPCRRLELRNLGVCHACAQKHNIYVWM